MLAQEREGARVLSANIHTHNDMILKRVDVLNHVVEKELPGQILDELMNINDDSTVLVFRHVRRFDDRINHRPLTGPVFPDTLPAEHTATFHSVRPVHVRVHGFQDGIDLAAIKGLVNVRQQLPF
jgi:hypothetical protein